MLSPSRSSSYRPTLSAASIVHFRQRRINITGGDLLTHPAEHWNVRPAGRPMRNFTPRKSRAFLILDFFAKPPAHLAPPNWLRGAHTHSTSTKLHSSTCHHPVSSDFRTLDAIRYLMAGVPWAIAGVAIAAVGRLRPEARRNSRRFMSCCFPHERSKPARGEHDACEQSTTR